MLAQFLPPAFGGTEQHVGALARALAGRGHKVTLLGFRTDAEPSYAESDGVRVIRVRSTANMLPSLVHNAGRPFALPFADPIVGRAIDRELSHSSYDVIHAHNWIVNSALRPAARHRLPVVMTLHDYGQTCATFGMMYRGRDTCPGPSALRCVSCATSHYGPIRGPLTVAANNHSARRRTRGVARFAAVSSAVADAAESSGVRVREIPIFIGDEVVVDEVRQTGPDAPVVFVGALNHNKGVGVLLRAYESLAGAPELVLAGRAHADNRWHFPAGTRWLGEVPHPDVLDLLRGARAVVVPSVWPEPCPTVVLEAMALGRPVVAAASGGIPDLIEDGISGVLVRPGDPAALAAGIERVLGDDRAARAFGLAARDRVRRFTASAVVGRIESLYGDAIAEGSG